ncbi:hypothetical protein C8Q70DRAFT_1057018 [Cubamyces menziesii]|nr:hypothetical protein C8Q70DRAFT_1057018 [Cubamyces menziesii]
MSAPFLHLLGFPSLDTTLGSIYLGTTMGVMYYKHYPEDPLLYPKGLVTTVLLFDTIHTVQWMYIGYRYTVLESFDLPGILSSHWTISSTFVVTSFCVFTCQTFYACRIWNSFGIVASAKAFADEVHKPKSTINGLSPVLDSIVSFISFLFALLLRGNLIYAGVSIVGAKLYANSVLALLNSRKYLNNRLQDDFTSVNLGGSDMRSGALAPVRQAERPAQRGRAREETSTIIWAARQGSTILSHTSALSGMNFAAARSILDEVDEPSAEDVRGEEPVLMGKPLRARAQTIS